MKANRLMVAVALALVFCAAGQLHAQEVTFEGKTLTEWTAELKDGDWEQRLMAAWALGEIGPAAAAAVPELVKAVQDEDAWLRMYSAHALGVIGQATEAERTEMRRLMTFVANVVNDEDWNPTKAGWHRGNVNMPPRHENHLGVAATVLPNHPLASKWAARSRAELEAWPCGSRASSTCCASHSGWPS